MEKLCSSFGQLWETREIKCLSIIFFLRSFIFVQNWRGSKKNCTFISSFNISKYLRFIQIRFIKPPTYHDPVLFPLCPSSWDEYWKAKCQQSLLENGFWATYRWKMEGTLWFDSIISKYTLMHWLAKLKWDGKQRLRFCSQLCEIDENTYSHILHFTIFFICLWNLTILESSDSSGNCWEIDNLASAKYFTLKIIWLAEKRKGNWKMHVEGHKPSL